jgi:sulfate transport system permease protein
MARFREFSVLPGFRLTFAVTLAWTSVLVVLPLCALAWRASSLGFEDFFAKVTEARALSAFWLSIWASFVAATVNVFVGLLTAWVLVRYPFPGRRIIDALVDLPFALPTAVSGIALTSLFAERGTFGALLAPLGVKVAYTPIGIVIALVFIGLPFVVRTVQPVLAELPLELEEAAATLGAGRLRTFFSVVLPPLVPPLLTGFALAFGRALGEYGSIVFIAGNMPHRTEILPLLIVIELEEYDYAGATALGGTMLLLSFALLFVINALQSWSRRRAGAR